MPLDENGLTVKQKLFCDNYIANGYNASKAARDSGYSETSAREIGRENLTKHVVTAYLEKRMKEVFEKIGAGVEWRAELLKKTAQASFEGKASKDGIINTHGVLGSVAEMNKMDGTYAPDKHAVLVEDDNGEGKVSNLMKKYEREY